MNKTFGNEIAKCPHCSNPIGDENPYIWCIKCGEQLPDNIISLVPNLKTTKKTNPMETNLTKISNSPKIFSNGEGLIMILQLLAFVNLVAGVIVGFRIIATIAGDFGTFLGIFFIIEAFLGCALLLAVGLIADNILSIRKNVEIYFKKNE